MAVAPLLPSGEADFTSSSSRNADSWSSGPPFSATFTFPAFAYTLGSTISEHWMPVSGTVTVEET